MTTIALNKYLANAGVCSRRAAVQLVKSGVITVNGTVVTEPGFKIADNAVVLCRNRRIVLKELLYILLNKPAGYVTTKSDEEGRKTVMDLLLDKRLREQLYPIGRLDCNTTGVLLMTNDGELAYQLSHPKFEVPKVYTAVLDQPLQLSDLTAIKKGVKLKDGVVMVDAIQTYSNGTVVRIAIHSGRYRIIRRIFTAFNYRVKKLDRTEFAGLNKRGMPSGAYRFLSPVQIKRLKSLASKMPREKASTLSFR